MREEPGYEAMTSSELLLHRIWRASQRKAIHTPSILPQSRALQPGASPKAPENVIGSRALVLQTCLRKSTTSPSINNRLILRLLPTENRPKSLIVSRLFSASCPRKEEKPTATELGNTRKATQNEDDLDAEDEEQGFARSEKASQNAQVNLSARLAKDGKSQGQAAGFGEVWRLIKIAKPEVGILGIAFIFLLISSSVSMSIPFSIGRILDIATKSDAGSQIFGLELSTFYLALGGFLALGAAANYGRIIVLRIVGERIVARLRSQLFRRTFVQNAEFFDANRVGDLISRLSSDTIIVGKSITQNMSDGLRSLVSGAAGFGLMAFVSLKLTGFLALMFPPVAIGAFFYGKAIRNLSRRIQRNLGSLTKIAEERLGNVRTSQAFAGEILEVARYNKQVKKIFNLGKREALISATFFSTVSLLRKLFGYSLTYRRRA